MKHTPGPWRWTIDESSTILWGGSNQLDDSNIVMAEFFGTGHPETIMPDGADADLIESAPDMKKALERIVKEYLEDKVYHSISYDAYTQASIALTKANGGCKGNE